MSRTADRDHVKPDNTSGNIVKTPLGTITFRTGGTCAAKEMRLGITSESQCRGYTTPTRVPTLVDFHSPSIVPCTSNLDHRLLLKSRLL